MDMEMVADADNGTISNYYLPPSIRAASSIFRLGRFGASVLGIEDLNAPTISQLSFCHRVNLCHFFLNADYLH
jgi:hypothetical protein